MTSRPLWRDAVLRDAARAAALAALLLPAAGARPTHAQDSAGGAASSTAPSRPAHYPFGVGEVLQYAVAVGGARVGTARMQITDVEDVGGHATYHSQFTVDGGFLMFKVHDIMESWFDTATLSSRRFVQKINEVNYHTERYYDIYPERALMQKRGSPEEASVSSPLDDASFLYFVRTVPLEVGQTYVFDRYFRPDRNPVIVKVLRREQVKVAAGTFDAIVIQPIIKSQGLFAEGGEAIMWISNDSRRMMVQFHAKVPLLRTLDLYLQSYQPPTETAATAR